MKKLFYLSMAVSLAAVVVTYFSKSGISLVPGFWRPAGSSEKTVMSSILLGGKSSDDKNPQKAQAEILENIKALDSKNQSKELTRKLNDGTATQQEREEAAKSFQKRNELTEQWLSAKVGEANHKLSELEKTHQESLKSLKEDFQELGVTHEN